MKNHLEDLNLLKIISQLAESQTFNQQLSKWITERKKKTMHTSGR